MTKFIEEQMSQKKDLVLCEMIRFQTDRGLDKKEFNIDNEMKLIMEELLEAKGVKDDENKTYSKLMVRRLNSIVDMVIADEPERFVKPTDHDQVDAFCDAMEFLSGAILKKGYNPILALDEMTKQINSRTGKFIDGKFEKDRSPEAKAKEYQADFTNAKLVDKMENKAEAL